MRYGPEDFEAARDGLGGVRGGHHRLHGEGPGRPLSSPEVSNHPRRGRHREGGLSAPLQGVGAGPTPSTLPGSRHSELVRHAVALWAWVREGFLSENEVVEVLGAAALESGLPEREVAGVFSWVRGTHPMRQRAPWKEDG